MRKRCDAVAAIPQHGTLTSLNVGVAGAVACFERQSGQREVGVFLAKRLGEDLLKRRVTAEGLEQVADGGVGHGKNGDGA